MALRDSKGRFVKGHSVENSWMEKFKSKTPWNKGKKINMSDYDNYGMTGRKHAGETKKIMSNIHRGIHPSKESRLKMRNAKLGKVTSQETKRRLSLAGKGHIVSKETKIKISKSNKGKKHSEQTKNKIRIARAKQIFPVKDSSIEIKIQNFLKQLGIEYFTHQHMKIEHFYKCDIFIPSMNLVIECDGDYWHGNLLKFPNPPKHILQQKERDKIRTEELTKEGFQVMRIWECEIKSMNIESMQEKLSITKRYKNLAVL